MAATALRPLSVTFMDLLAGSDCEVEEFLLSSDPDDLGSLDGASLAELQIGARSGALVLAILPPKAKPEGQVRQYRGSQYSPEAPTLIANPAGARTSRKNSLSSPHLSGQHRPGCGGRRRRRSDLLRYRQRSRYHINARGGRRNRTRVPRRW